MAAVVELVDTKREGRNSWRCEEPELTGPKAGLRRFVSPWIASEQAEIPPCPKQSANGKRSGETR